MNRLRFILFPFSLLYGAGVWIFHKLYHWEVLQSFQFDIPVISVGNLSVGGTGKSPMVEYLVRLLQKDFHVATLSRGYGRKTIGYIFAKENATAEEIGDEPAQFKRKFAQLAVGVSENRNLGIPNLLADAPDTGVVIMDDAFQSLSVKPGVSILLTEFSRLFTDDFLLPMGWLREFRSGYKRADIIVVTKCPAPISERRKDFVISKIKPLAHQQVYFSTLAYGEAYVWQDKKQLIALTKEWEAVVICGIARTDLLLEYLKGKLKSINVLKFSDHHHYTIRDLTELKKEFDRMSSEKKIIITTEKDAVRLEKFKGWFAENKLPVYCLPVSLTFLDEEGKFFDSYIFNFLKKSF